nr:hypothetical protein [uncultured Hyphomonas sp.]
MAADQKNKSSINISDILLYGAPAAIVALIASILTITGAVSDVLERVQEPHRSIYSAGLVVFALLLVLVFTLLLVLMRQRTIFAKNISAVRDQHTNELGAAKNKYVKVWDRTTRSIDAIVSKLYDIEETRWKFTKVSEVYTIEDDGTTLVERRYTVEAGDKPAQIWRVMIDADQSADNIEYLEGLSLEINAEAPINSEAVEYLLYVDKPLHKKIAVFFLPEITAGQERKVKMTYRWPGFARDLISGNSTVFSFNYRTCDPTDTADVEIEFRVSKKIGTTGIEMGSVAEGNMNWSTQDSASYTIHKFTCPDMGMNHRELRIRLLRG